MNRRLSRVFSQLQCSNISPKRSVSFQMVYNVAVCMVGTLNSSNNMFFGVWLQVTHKQFEGKFSKIEPIKKIFAMEKKCFFFLFPLLYKSIHIKFVKKW